MPLRDPPLERFEVDVLVPFVWLLVRGDDDFLRVEIDLATFCFHEQRLAIA